MNNPELTRDEEEKIRKANGDLETALEKYKFPNRHLTKGYFDERKKTLGNGEEIIQTGAWIVYKNHGENVQINWKLEGMKYVPKFPMSIF
ncbi:hypothetical protein COU59_00695 [Candidatus Pacearchaeota archaeon CG10_big_fil_rev_8_21_14_0_10_34_12]|nr:MAG: hypothetical protein COU59_00695 [Candidatus Pacearchaeota archaeon CG10_big_fil_rev_8_21_14_0_10_34_12]